MNDTYRITEKTRRAYLRIYRHRWRTRKEIIGEIDLLRFLKRRGVDVSYPIRRNNGSYIGQFNAPEGRRYAVLFSDARGKPPKIDSICSKRYGHLAGTIHKLTDIPPKKFRRFQLDLDHLIQRPLTQIKPFLEHRPRDIDFLTHGKRVRLGLFPFTAPINEQSSLGSPWRPRPAPLDDERLCLTSLHPVQIAAPPP